jgi:tRNA pseudouridine13 synthase
MTEPPRQLADFAPVPGLIKTDYADFVVEELPLYPADGVGTHTYFLLEKTGLSTMQAVADIARALNVRRHEIGLAGLKDARAVTRQWMSIEHVEPERVAALDIPRLRVLETTRHHNKLRLGHLRGNHFVIRVRQTETERLAAVQDAVAQLAARGVPNYFGVQRFGYRGDTWEVGRAILRNEPEEALALILGRPGPQDHGDIRRARQLYDRGDLERAMRHWPRMFRSERQALRALLRPKSNARRALSAIDRSTRNFYVSAYQSYLFNAVLAARLPTGLEQLWEGDLAWLHASGAVFTVESVADEQPRADRFEISPSGPLFGYRMTEPTGRAAEIEDEVRQREQLDRNIFQSGKIRIKGSRRPLRFQPTDTRVELGADQQGPYLELRFTLPRGCYATSLLRELFHAAATADAEDVDTETEAAPDGR